ncbi:MAG: response regulator transcription factor [Oscillospiraceae bacterium]|nr:response regulator transcription factor [Oscillospiraceae bacterium]
MIYCVEDDKDILQIMMYTLKSSGFEVKGFEESCSFWQAIEQEKPRLVMLDIMLPGEDGMSILNTLRNTRGTRNIPVIMATAKGTEYDKVIGLDSGADAYLTKPFGMLEMVAQIRAVLRRSGKISDHKLLTAGALEINLTDHYAAVNGEKLSLTYKEYELLKLLMEHQGRVYTRDQLLDNIWGADYTGETRTVDVHIGSLREKLKDCADYIVTVRGVGYKLEEKE